MELSDNKKNSFLFVLLFMAGQVFCQNNITPVEKQAQELMKYFASPTGVEKLFTEAFIKKVPALQLTGVFKQYFASSGNCIKIALVKSVNEYSAKYDFFFDKKFSVPVTIAVEAKEPFLINSLFFGPPVFLAADFTELINELKLLPGKTSLLAAKLTDGGITPLVEYNSGSHMAIGSAFKLYILSELIHSINNGERKWTDIIELKKEAISLPSGVLHLKPAGTKIRLDSLATYMISISDNTATDNLLYLAGRENVEKILPVTGHSKPELNIPFLATMEMFKLKGDPSKKVINAYIESNDKRKFITEELPKIKRESFVMWKGPLFIDKVEWFASTKDLCNVMNWIRINTNNEKDNITRNVLSKNPGIPISKDKWSYIGYKGGSEPGVMNMTYLLRSAAGEWYALSCGWNDTNAPVDESKFAGMVSRAVQLLESKNQN